MIAKIKRGVKRVLGLTTPFEKADQIFTHTTQPERLLLFEFAKKTKGNVLEIGSYLGASSCYIAEGLYNTDRKLYCVDTWQNHAMTEGQKDTFSSFNTNTKRYDKNIVKLRGFSGEVSKTANYRFGFGFFDGDHSYEGVKIDWDSWKDKFEPGALICFHDYGWAEGVQKLVAEEIKPIAKEHGELPNLFWARI